MLDQNRKFAAEQVAASTLMPSLPAVTPHIKATIIGCVDMRVNPEDILGVKPGEALVIRNIGGRVTPVLLQELGLLGRIGQVMHQAPGGGGEFHLIVLHHTDCGITRLAGDPAMLAKYFQIEEERDLRQGPSRIRACRSRRDWYMTWRRDWLRWLYRRGRFGLGKKRKVFTSIPAGRRRFLVNHHQILFRGLIGVVALCSLELRVAMAGTATKAPTTPAAITTGEHAPQPSSEMQSLTKAISGHWTTVNVYGPVSAKSVVYHGDQVWRIGPGGFTLLEEEHGNTPSGEFFLLALHWWDSSTKTFKGMLCNNTGPGACDVDSYFHSSVGWDGKQLVIDLEFPQAGKKMHWHEVFGDFTPDSFTQTGDLGEVGGTPQRFVTIHATRVVEKQ